MSVDEPTMHYFYLQKWSTSSSKISNGITQALMLLSLTEKRRREKVRREWKSLVSIWCQSDKIFFSDVYPRVQHIFLHSELELISWRSVVSDKSPRKFDLFPKPQYTHTRLLMHDFLCLLFSSSLPM
uniref:(northern house mosquito) hypothetical protein n=1 Tax=Culex pipiens TaxID=7175 RepID=A0A8D8AIH4_CULPI